MLAAASAFAALHLELVLLSEKPVVPYLIDCLADELKPKPRILEISEPRSRRPVLILVASDISAFPQIVFIIATGDKVDQLIRSPHAEMRISPRLLYLFLVLSIAPYEFGVVDRGHINWKIQTGGWILLCRLVVEDKMRNRLSLWLILAN